MNAKRLVFLLGLAGFIVMADNWVVSPILPAIAQSLHVQAASAGILIAAYMLPFGLFQLVYGPLADRLGKFRVISVTLALFTVATGLCGFGLGLADLAAYRALTGLFAAATMPISLALIGDVVPLEERQIAIGTFMGISFLGQALSMGIGGTIAYLVNWRGVFIAYAALAALITAILMTAGRRVAGQASQRGGGPVLAPYVKLLGHLPSLATYLVVLGEGVLVLGSFSYLGANIAQAFHFNYLGIGLIMTAFGVGAVLAGRVSGAAAERVGRKRLVAGGLLLGAVADLLVAGFSASLALTILGVFLLGLGFMLAHSTLLTLATEFARQARGVAMSMVTFCFMVGGAIGTGLGARLIAAQGYQAFFVLYGVLLLGLGMAGLVAINEDLGQRKAAPAAD
jgi:predicted MFS family arabinose efflux permease